MNNFNNNQNNNNETVRQTLLRVAGQHGWFDHPVNMNIDGNNVTYYVDNDSPFAQKQQTPTPWNNNYQQQNFDTTNQTQMNQQLSPWYRKTYDKVYNEAYKLKNEPLYDKYKHSVVSCIGGQDGLYGSAVTAAMGVGKEVQDIFHKIPRQWTGKQNYGGYLSIFGDSFSDLAADAKGIYTGYQNPLGNCYDMMKPYYNPNKK